MQTEEQCHTILERKRMFVHKIPRYILLGGVATYIPVSIVHLLSIVTKNSGMSLFGDENGSIFRHCAIARI